MPKKESVTVQGTEITILSYKKDDYISLTDMAQYKRLLICRWKQGLNKVSANIFYLSTLTGTVPVPSREQLI